MRTGLRIPTPLGVLCALISLAPSLARSAAAQTDGFILHCASARATGMGCVARGQEGIPTTLFRDPAGIVAFNKPAFEANLTAFVPALSFTNAANASADGAVHAYPMGSMAYVGSRVHGVSWAIGMEPIGGLGSDFRLKNAVIGAAQNYESFFAALKAGPVLAYRLTPTLSVGGSISLVYGQVRDFRMPFSMPASSARGMAGLMQLDPQHYQALFGGMSEMTAYGDSKAYAGTAVTGDLGLSWAPSPKLRVSASWSPKTPLDLSGGTARMDMSKQFEAMFGALVQERMMNHAESQTQAMGTVQTLLGGAGIDMSKGAVANYDAAMTMTLPQSAGIGATFRPAAGWTLAFEGGWMGWKKAEYDMPFKLTGSDNANVNILVNGSPTDASFTYPFPLRWKDSWVAKLGVERSFGATALRAGYAYGSNPVPSNAVFITFPAIVEHSAMVGATLPLGPLPLDIALARTFDKQLVGAASSLVGSEYQGSTTHLRETAITVGTVLHF